MGKIPYATQLKAHAARRRAIRKRYRTARSFAVVAREFGISRQRAAAIVAAKS
jgi:hypothetical protein